MRKKKLQSAITFLSVERFLKTWAQHKEDKIVFNLIANTVPLFNLIKKYSAKTHLDAYQCAQKLFFHLCLLIKKKKQLQSAITFLSVDRFLKTWAQHREDKIVFNVIALLIYISTIIYQHTLIYTHLNLPNMNFSDSTWNNPCFLD